MKKLLSYRFQWYFVPFTMLPVEGSSKTALFQHFSNHVFAVRNLSYAKSVMVILLSKILNI